MNSLNNDLVDLYNKLTELNNKLTELNINEINNSEKTELQKIIMKLSDEKINVYSILCNAQNENIELYNENIELYNEIVKLDNNPIKLQFLDTFNNIQYSKHIYEEDSEDLGGILTDSLYTIIGLSTEDSSSISLPLLYFIPKTIKLHPELHCNYIRCTYNNEYSNELINWIVTNAKHTICLNKLINCANFTDNITKSNIMLKKDFN